MQDRLSPGAEEGAPRDHGHVDVRAEEDLGPWQPTVTLSYAVLQIRNNEYG